MMILNQRSGYMGEREGYDTRRSGYMGEREGRMIGKKNSDEKTPNFKCLLAWSSG